jgi:host factor-I protein
MATETSSIQNNFIKELIKDNIPVSVFLVNGIKLHGTIVDSDTCVVLLKGIVTQMIFKHAISTIVPAKPEA